jgi:hypothetical protein
MPTRLLSTTTKKENKTNDFNKKTQKEYEYHQYFKCALRVLDDEMGGNE